MINTDYTYDTKKANFVITIASFISIGVFLLVYFLIWGWNNAQEVLITTSIRPFLRTIFFVILLIIGIVVHELIHALAFFLVGKVDRTHIKIGSVQKALTPYTHCQQKMEVAAYRLSMAVPSLLLGLIPLGIGYITGSFFWFLWGVVHSIGGYGDMLILWKIRKLPKDLYVIDHPDRLGCTLLLP